MQLSFVCPQCNKALVGAAEYAGRKIRCPGCTHTFRVPSSDIALPAAVPAVEAIPDPAPATPREDVTDRDEDLPRRRTGRRPRQRDEDDELPAPLPAGSAPAWGLVRYALDLIHWGILVNVLGPVAAIILTLMFGLVASDLEPKDRGTLAIPLIAALVAIGLACIASSFAVQIGLAYNCFVPLDSRAKSLAIATLVVNANILPLMFLTRIIERSFESEARDDHEVVMLPVTGAIGTCIGVATTVLFVLFLRRVALYLRDRGLAQRLQTYLIFYGCLAGLVILGALGGVVSSFSWKSHSSSTSERTYDYRSEEEFRRDERYRSHERERDSEVWNTLGPVVILVLVVVLLLALGINVAWLLGLIRAVRDRIGRAERAAPPALASPGGVLQ